MSYDDPNRRPIAAREMKFSQVWAKRLADSGMTANSISVWSIVFGVLAGICLYFTSVVSEYHSLLYVGCACSAMMRLLCNMFDGMVAIATGTSSAVGELYNEVPDRVSDTAIFIAAGYAAGGHPELGLAAALAAMLTAYVRTTGKGAGTHHEFCGPFAKQQRMFLVIVACLYLSVGPDVQFAWLSGGGVLALLLLVITIGSVITSWRRLVKISAALQQN